VDTEYYFCQGKANEFTLKSMASCSWGQADVSEEHIASIFWVEASKKPAEGDSKVLQTGRP
jgi:hypothetical protein